MKALWRLVPLVVLAGCESITGGPSASVAPGDMVGTWAYEALLANCRTTGTLFISGVTDRTFTANFIGRVRCAPDTTSFEFDFLGIAGRLPKDSIYFDFDNYDEHLGRVRTFTHMDGDLRAHIDTLQFTGTWKADRMP